jgi:hypothetical protein
VLCGIRCTVYRGQIQVEGLTDARRWWGWLRQYVGEGGTGVWSVRDRRDALSATGSFASLEADARSATTNALKMLSKLAPSWARCSRWCFPFTDARDEGVAATGACELPPLMLAMKEFSLLFLWVKNCSTCQSAGGRSLFWVRSSLATTTTTGGLDR